MKRITQLKEQIAVVNCDRELGWLQLRLLVLNLLNTMVPLTCDKKISATQINELQALYKQYLQVPFTEVKDSMHSISVKNEVIRQLSSLEEQFRMHAA